MGARGAPFCFFDAVWKQQERAVDLAAVAGFSSGRLSFVAAMAGNRYRLHSLSRRQCLRLRLVRKYAERGLPIPQFLLASWDSLEMSIFEWRQRYNEAWEDMLLYDDIGLPLRDIYLLLD